jgi:hypothetical protein
MVIMRNHLEILVQLWSTYLSDAYLFAAYFHGGNTGSNPVGDAKSFQTLSENDPIPRRHKKAQFQPCLSPRFTMIINIHRLEPHFCAGTKRHKRSDARSDGRLAI